MPITGSNLPPNTHPARETHAQSWMLAETNELNDIICNRNYLINSAIICAHDKSIRVHVQNQILTHDGQADKCNVSLPAKHMEQQKILNLWFSDKLMLAIKCNLVCREIAMMNFTYWDMFEEYQLNVKRNVRRMKYQRLNVSSCNITRWLASSARTTNPLASWAMFYKSQCQK